MAGTLHTMDNGCLDPGHKASGHHLGEAEETRDHSHPDTTTPGTRIPQ